MRTPFGSIPGEESSPILDSLFLLQTDIAPPPSLFFNFRRPNADLYYATLVWEAAVPAKITLFPPGSANLCPTHYQFSNIARSEFYDEKVASPRFNVPSKWTKYASGCHVVYFYGVLEKPVGSGEKFVEHRLIESEADSCLPKHFWFQKIWTKIESKQPSTRRGQYSQCAGPLFPG